MEFRNKILTVWISYCISTVVFFAPFIGVFLALKWRKDADAERRSGRKDILAGHFDAQVRVFGRALKGWVLAITILAATYFLNRADIGGSNTQILMFLGIALAVLAQIYFTVASFVGIIKAVTRTPTN